MSAQYDSRLADKFVVRLPDGMRSQVEAAADSADRSMNSVFIQALRRYLDNQNRQELLLGALAASVDNARVNQIALGGENVNQQQNAPQNIPEIIPGPWTDVQCLDFCSVALRHVVVEGDLKLSDINDALRYMTDKYQAPAIDSMHIDDRVRMAANAKRYEWLRDVAATTGSGHTPMVKVAGGPGRWRVGDDLDQSIDQAMKSWPLHEKEVEPCAD